ncbi:hypothetical protein [Bifidobacterium sp. SO1]|uniref:hypothetical protein n=1 Tax=Bifidobacterium sp. SO1 TaxID=2809029 RepID=UPI001BDD2772|nr:hypothetical protein [Bifidobacterium sp. SO1]MBT1162856.1 hypothetical protein [Bifidobacterium sp. SO1]
MTTTGQTASESMNGRLALAVSLQEDFLTFKHRLVEERKNQYPESSIQDFLTFIGWTKEHLLKFEEYDYDPKASEIREYALAVGMRINSRIERSCPTVPLNGFSTKV